MNQPARAVLSGLPTRQLARIPVTVAREEGAVTAIIRSALDVSTSARTDVHLVNAYSIALSDRDAALREVFRGAGENFPDGKPLTWLSSLQSPRLRQVRGPSLFTGVMDIGRANGLRHYLLGSTPETLALLETELVRRFPAVEIVGTFSPPFRNLTVDDLVGIENKLRESRCQIVWVGLGTPKQDFVASDLARRTGLVTVAIGAAFDFVAGTKPEAPAWMSKIGLEWLFRLITEPRRLWKRYLFGNVRFLWAVAVGGRR